MAKVGINKHLFEILAAAQEKGLTNAALAEKTGINPTLLSMSEEKGRSLGVCRLLIYYFRYTKDRILRYLQSIGTIYQPENDLYIANNITEALASIQGRTAITHKFVPNLLCLCV